MPSSEDQQPDGMLTEEERELIKGLRKEAYEVKDCFTRFSFQALALSAAGLGLIVRFQDHYPLLGFAAVPIIVLLMTVVGIGQHKYETANRLYGYELHVHRRARLKDSRKGGWKSHMRRIGWEEAFYAWRVVQPMIYWHLYKKLRLGLPTRKTDHYENADPKWFEPARLTDEPRPSYYAGSYHFKIDFVLCAFSVFAWLALPIMC